MGREYLVSRPRPTTRPSSREKPITMGIVASAAAASRPPSGEHSRLPMPYVRASSRTSHSRVDRRVASGSVPPSWAAAAGTIPSGERCRLSHRVRAAPAYSPPRRSREMAMDHWK